MIGTRSLAATLFPVVTVILASPASAQNGLQITYGAKGLQTLAYAGTTLESTAAFPADTFHIWHMRVTDLNGNLLAEDGWGETNLGESWSSATNTETYTFPWGTLATQFVQTGNTLNLVVTETNNPGSGVLLDGAEIYPFALRFPQDPAGFAGYTQYAITTLEPGVSIADFGTGIVTAVLPNEAVPLYTGWKSAGPDTYTPIMTSTAPDGLATFLPSNNLPVSPGTTFTYTVSLRFTPEGNPANVADAYASFAATYPSQMTWTDHRAIGTAYLASSPAGTGNVTEPGGFPTNPRRYFNDPTVDITTAAGLHTFQDRMLAQAASIVTNAQALAAQGIITWDIEGEQYPQSTSYVCSPDQIATVAPEMETTVSDTASAYFGQKLDDAYFKTISSAGLRVGLCLRPQVFALAQNGTASQVYLTTNTAIIANLETKARYAHTRWGATLFYVDSTVDPNGGTLDPAIFQQLITDLPGFLFIPEESTPRYYAYTAPFYSFLFHTTLGTPASTYSYYPRAFGANLINDVSANTLATYQPQLTAAVEKGDILMGHADYWQANDPTIRDIDSAAGVSAPTTPTQTKPTITWATPSAIPYGTALSATQFSAKSNVAGTFVYSPSAGTIPNAGTDTLLATFTPTDATTYKSVTATVTLSVTRAIPTITWPTPAAITVGTALSTTQLNATANVPGTFTYSPSLGTISSAGTTTLTATFTPANTTNYAVRSATTTLTVNAATVPASKLAILSPSPNITVSGTISITGQCTLSLDAAGTYLMVDGAEVGTQRVTGAPYVYALNTTTLTNGAHTLQLWGHDTSNTTTISTAVVVNVAN